MDTNLKTGKIIRHLIYRIFLWGSLALCIFYAYASKNIIHIMWEDQSFNYLLYGNVWEDVEFQKYIGEIYNHAMISLAGIGDDKGYPLTDSYSKLMEERYYNNFTRTMDDYSEYCYYVDAPKMSLSTFDGSIFSEYDKHLNLPEDMSLFYYWDGSVLYYKGDYEFTRSQYNPCENGMKNVQFIMAFRKNASEYTDPQVIAAMKRISANRFNMFVFLGSLCAFVISFILCLITRKAFCKEKCFFSRIKRYFWVEIKALGFFILGFILYFSFFQEMRFLISAFLFGAWIYLCFFLFNRVPGEKPVSSMSGTLIGLAVETIRMMHWSKRATLLYLCPLFLAIIIFLIQLFNAHPYEGISLLLFLVILSLLGLFVILRTFMKDTRKIAGKIEELQNGITDNPLSVSRYSLLKEEAENINHLEEGIELAVEQRDRSNKMRVDLITNVSHDLKTPLTSIINYADLLCEEKLPEPSHGYALSLQAKAYRLKRMVQDVFELSKATSGNLKMNFTTIDLIKLIKQTLADMDEKIAGSNLVFKTVFEADSVPISADSDKLYRVFQNLYVNALKYSLDNSRVYTQVTLDGDNVNVRVKNTSREELDFDTEEITERFVRADSSRTEEGSGLGLSIARSFTESMNGTFHIETDGDLFTACLSFPIVS